MKHYNVVAAVIQQNDKFFCVQKGLTKYNYTSYKYEFPGGKIEVGETPQQALKREMIEELDYKIEVDRQITTVNHRYPDFEITLSVFLCHGKDDFKLKEHISYKWLKIEEMGNLEWAAADAEAIKALKESIS